MEKILLAEFIGIMLGDGNLYCNNKGQYVIRITGDLNKDKKYHEDFISNLFYGLFNKEMRVQIYPDRIVLCCYSKHIFDQLISFGLKHGNKLENNVYIPDWIFDDDRYVMAFFKGLIDTDGSVFPKSTNKEFFQIEISCAIPNLRESILVDLGNTLPSVSISPLK